MTPTMGGTDAAARRQGDSTDVCVPVSRLAELRDAGQGAAGRRRAFIAPILWDVGDGEFHSLLLIDIGTTPPKIERAEALHRLAE